MVWGLTTKADQRARGRAVLNAAMKQPVATAKTGPSDLALEDHQLVAKDHYLDFGGHLYVGRPGDQPDQTAQQQIHEGEEHEPNLLREGGPILRTRWARATISGLCALQGGEDEPATLRMLRKRVSAIRLLTLDSQLLLTECAVGRSVQDLRTQISPTRLAGGVLTRASVKAIRADLTGGEVRRNRRSQG
jgi:hypothetical protein